MHSELIHFEHVSKKYRLGAGSTNLREALLSLPRALMRQKKAEVEGADYIWAIKDLSFTLRKGDILGLVGQNGAGKTTLLKLISRVTRPTQGNLHTEGRISSLIELGAGFHPDLTGRENILLNGVILGMSQKKIAEKFDQIADFSELRSFLDTPVKRYSSGMYARLGFAVAAHSDPDLLLVDEVLSVGDANFQRKCYDFIRNFAAEGNTAVFVSHSLYVLEQLCTRLIWIDHGQLQAAGTPQEVLPQYLDRMDHLRAANLKKDFEETESFKINAVQLLSESGAPVDTFATGEDITIRIDYAARSRIPRPHFHIGVYSPEGFPLFISSMLIDGAAPESISGDGWVGCLWKSVPLLPKAYSVWAEVWGADREEILFRWQQVSGFRIAAPDEEDVLNLGKGSITRMRYDAPVKVDYRWIFSPPAPGRP